MNVEEQSVMPFGLGKPDTLTETHCSETENRSFFFFFLLWLDVQAVCFT